MDILTTLSDSTNKLNQSNIAFNEKNVYMKMLFSHDILTQQLNQSDRLSINDQLYDDLEIFDGNNPIINNIDKTETEFGSYYMKFILKNPLFSKKMLINRQKQIQSFEYIKDSSHKSLQEIKPLIDDLLWFWKPISQETQNLFDIVYYKNKYLNFVNNNPIMMNVSTYCSMYLFPLIQLLSPLIPIVVMLLVLSNMLPDSNFRETWEIIKSVYDFRNIGTVQIISLIIWMIIYLYGTYSVIMNAILQYRIVSFIHTKLYHLSKFYHLCKNLHTQYNDLCLQTNTISENVIDPNFINQSLTYLSNYLNVNSQAKLFDNKGHILSTFQSVYQSNEIKNHLVVLCQFAGYIDCFSSISQLRSNGYSDVHFIDQIKPIITFDKIWHPCLDRKNTVPNSSKINNHRIISGPNAGGKSTYIKNVAILILLSHTLTVVNCNKAIITPHKLLHSYIRLIDVKGVASLFEAEVDRCLNFIKNVNDLKNNEFGFAIFDEMFTSTNFYEGVSAAHAICLEMLKYPNLLTLTTTHYKQLSELENDSNGKFKNYMVTIEKLKDGQIAFNYKIKRGVSNQFIALDLLKIKGFNQDIIDNALKYLDNLQKIKN